MTIKLSDLKWYGSATMPDDDVATAIGGAIDQAKKVHFTDVNGTLQIVSSAAGDTTQTITVHGRNAAGALINQAIALNGTTVVPNGTTFERLTKAIKSATCAGDVAVEAQAAERSNTAQAGAADTIQLDAGASAVDDFYAGMVIRLTGGTGSGQIREIVAYNGTTKQATVSRAWGVTPDNTSTFRIAKGFYFDLLPTEITQVRRPFYDAAANAPGGGAVDYYEKVFACNRNGADTLSSAKVIEAADPSTKITFGLASAINDTGTNGANNRKVAPGGVTFDNADKNVPGGVLATGDRIGVWLKLSLLDGDAAQKTTYTPRLTGTTT
jgi:hypothetical protein